MTPKPTRQAIFTPWAAFLCERCHGKLTSDLARRVHAKVAWNDCDLDDEPGFCTECGTAVYGRSDVAILTRIMRGVEAGRLVQAGGMTSALHFVQPSGKLVCVTIDDVCYVGTYESEENFGDAEEPLASAEAPHDDDPAMIAAVERALRDAT